MEPESHHDRQGLDAMVLTIYEWLFIGQPQIGIEGIWAIGEHYYFVCPGFNNDAKAVDGSPILEWLFDPFGWPLPPIEIVEQAPSDSRKVETRSVEAKVELRGVTRIMRDIFADLTLALGPEFPNFSLLNPHGKVEIHVERELEPRELSRLQAAAQSLQEPARITIVQRSKPPDALTFYRAATGDLTLVPSRALAADVPRKVRWLVEEDEEFWMSNRKEAFLGHEATSPLSMFPDDWRGNELRCVVDATVFPPANIRSYLTLFDTVFLGLPLGDKFAEALEHLGTTPNELIELLGTGRVKILLPQSIDRYPIDWLAEALDVTGNNFVGSRRIACGVLVDTRRRMPFLHPPLDFEDRRSLMAALGCAAVDTEISPELRRWFQIISKECRETWQFAPEDIQRIGSLQTARWGIAWLASRLHEECTGQERTIEIMGASAAVEWAAALNAHVFPKGTETYSDEAACHLLAALTSPLDVNRVPVADPRIHGIIDGILAIDNDIPVVDFARTFRGPISVDFAVS